MNIKLLDFDTVFDGTANFVPRAILDLSKAAKPRRFLREHGGRGMDGLDGFQAVPLALETKAGATIRFALWRHDGNPKGQVAIHLPLEEAAFQRDLAEIMAALAIPETAILWRDGPQLPKRVEPRPHRARRTG